MTDLERSRGLLQKISGLFEEGIEPGDDVWHFITSTFSEPDEPGLIALLGDESDPEVESLWELILFPDEHLQGRLEEDIRRAVLKPENEKEISDTLFRGLRNVRIRFPKPGIDITVKAPIWAGKAFLSRLNLSKSIDPRLPDAVHTHMPPEIRTPILVKLRNARFEFSEKKTRFICNYLERIPGEQNPADADEFLSLFEFVLRFLSEIRQEDNIYNTLMAKKRIYFRVLQEIGKYERLSRTCNMETLLMQGIRPPQMNREQALKTISRIDSVSRAVFGRTEVYDMFAGDLEPEEIDEPEVGDIVRRLSG